MNISLILPVHNEEMNLDSLFNEIFDSGLYSILNEIIFVDDFSEDKSSEIIEKLKLNYNKIKLLKNHKNYGQSYSIYKGIENAKSDVVATIDADGQNIPSDLLKLIKVFENNDFQLVSGIRNQRKDHLIKIISSKIANSFRRLILKDTCLDTGCSLKVFERSLFLSFNFFNGVHRFIPSLFECCGYKVKYIYVNHRKRIYGQSNYGTLKRMFVGIYDTFKVRKIILNKNKINV